ncbi:MAG TPA: hypothetical protein VLT13_06590, partial [Bacteroidota bacterium]|nr:hypothetical protein [Bacteroidota bacterium]
PSLLEPAGTLDRATGIHNKGALRHTFENRGKLYPRRKADGPDGEFPAKSGHEHIYRVNPFVGIPGNVIQGRYTSNEEWEAVGGYHNPVQTGRALLSVAMSDEPATWPATGWPVRDSLGKPVILSEQDSYCVYSDSSSKTPIGLHIRQTGYSWGVKPAANILFFKFEIVNTSGRTLDSLYFSMYNEFHIGNVSGGDPEYADDRFGFDPALGLVYKYDADRMSNEWQMNPLNNECGVMIIRTPMVDGVERGVTDWHYVRIDDDNNMDIDSLLFGAISSNPGIYNHPFWGPKLFHLGAAPQSLHFDDPSTVPLTGSDGTSYLSSGPYTAHAGEVLTFVTAIVAGSDHAELMEYARRARDIVRGDFAVASAPPPPQLQSVSGDRQVFLSWDYAAEQARDKFSRDFDFEGYRLYRSSDDGNSWVGMADFDKINGIGANTGLSYTYVDSAVTNGFTYWYSVTAYDRGDSLIPSLESTIGSNADLANIQVARPRETSLGLVPATLTQWTHTGSSNDQVQVFLKDPLLNDTRPYQVQFTPTATVERGNLSSDLRVTITNPDSALFTCYAVVVDTLSAVQTLRVIDIASGTVLLTQPYVSGSPMEFKSLRLVISDPDPDAAADQRPEPGDSILISPGLQVLAGPDTVIRVHRLTYGVPIAARNGVTLAITSPALITEAGLVSGKGLIVQPTVLYPDSVTDGTFRILVTGLNADSAKSMNILVRNSADAVIASRDSLRA